MRYLYLLLLITACGVQKPLIKTECAAFGDSITAGVGAITSQNAWAQRVCVDQHNYAVRGSILTAQQDIVKQQLGSNNYDVIFMLSGYNDMRLGTDPFVFGDTLRDTLSLIPSTKKIYIGNCLKMLPEAYGLHAPHNHGSDARVALFNEIIAEVVSEFPNATLVDLSDYDPTYLTDSDLVHPNQAGHDYIAYKFFLAMGAK